MARSSPASRAAMTEFLQRAGTLLPAAPVAAADLHSVDESGAKTGAGDTKTSVYPDPTLLPALPPPPTVPSLVALAPPLPA